jgi:hypothetical protein
MSLSRIAQPFLATLVELAPDIRSAYDRVSEMMADGKATVAEIEEYAEATAKDIGPIKAGDIKIGKRMIYHGLAFSGLLARQVIRARGE